MLPSVSDAFVSATSAYTSLTSEAGDGKTIPAPSTNRLLFIFMPLTVIADLSPPVRAIRASLRGNGLAWINRYRQRLLAPPLWIIAQVHLATIMPTTINIRLAKYHSRDRAFPPLSQLSIQEISRILPRGKLRQS